MTPLTWTGAGIGILLNLYVAYHAGWVRGYTTGTLHAIVNVSRYRPAQPEVDPRERMEATLREIQELPERDS